MRVLCVLYLAFSLFSCAKKSSASSTSATPPDPIVGTWTLGTAKQSCFPVPNSSLYFYGEEQTIKQEATYYSYQEQHKIYTDKACTNLAILQTFEGNYSVRAAIATVGTGTATDTDTTLSTLNTYQMTHWQANYTVSIQDESTLNRANLMTADGLQGGVRFCNLTQDWVLNQVVPVSGQTCALGLATNIVDGAMNILALSFNGQYLVIGEDTFGTYVQYPLVLIEQGLTEWYKLKQ